MKILFVVPSYKPAYIYGGTIVAISKLAECLVQLGHGVTVYTTTANGRTELEVESGKEMIVDGVCVRYFNRITKDHTHVSPALWRCLDKTVKDFDVVHIHSWWNFLVMGAVWICKRNGIKPTLSPHGMFSDYILNARNSKKKLLLHKLIGKKLLQNTFLHVSTQMESEESKKLIPDWEENVIPNLIQLPNKTYKRADNDIFTIGFLSRIDPKKGLELLIQALSKVKFRYNLLIAGSGNSDYIESLEKLAKDCGNSDKIKWVGWKKGEEKFDFLSKLNLFALTSHSENFAIVVIEALSVGTPVLISNQIGLFNYIRENDFGWVCDLDIQQLTFELDKIYADNQKLKRINKIGAEKVKQDFDTESLTNQYVLFYQKIIEH